VVIVPVEIAAIVRAVVDPVVTEIVADLHAVAAAMRADTARMQAELQRASTWWWALLPVAGHA